MDAKPEARKPANSALCGTCRHARPIESDRGSVFIRCELALTDPQFAKYPRLPVLACDGYEAEEGRENSRGRGEGLG